MEKVIITKNEFELSIYQDNKGFQFISINELLNSMQIDSNREEIYELIKIEVPWVPITQMQVGEIVIKDLVPLTHSLFLMNWIINQVYPNDQMKRVYTTIVNHIESTIHFYKLKLEGILEIYDRIQHAYKEMMYQNAVVFQKQDELISDLKKALTESLQNDIKPN